MREALVISYYTVDTPYEGEAKRLQASCVKWNIEAEIQGVKSHGTWERNCAIKPAFILQMLEKHRRPLFWVDADALFLQKPEFGQFSDCDIAVRINDFLAKDHESYIASGSIFINDTLRAKEVIALWQEECAKQIALPGRVLEYWDQMGLRDVLQRKLDTKITSLPLGYCKIFDLDDIFIRDEDVVVEHRQASRLYKTKIR